VRRTTLASGFEFAGVGVHTGESSRVMVEPGPYGSGLVLRSPTGSEIPVAVAWVVAANGATVLERGGFRVQTPEHLLAALVGHGITDARIGLDGPEVPILDGSSKPYCDAIEQVGLRAGPAVEPLRLRSSVEVELAGGRAVAEPSEDLQVGVAVDYGSPDLPRGTAEVTLRGSCFATEVGWARTFALQRDVERLLAAGRGKGASADNTVIFGPAGPTAPLRGPDEPVRHKLLDLVGDLALIGRPLVARVCVERGSHALHHALVRAILAA